MKISKIKVLFLLALIVPLQAASLQRAKPSLPRNLNVGNLPLSFEANEGQANSSVRFISRGRGYTLLLTEDGADLSLQKTAVSMKLVNARQARLTGLDELPGKSNYFIGNEPAQWHVNIPTYARVKYDDVYPGIDLVYYGNQQQLEYDFLVSPGAD